MSDSPGRRQLLQMALGLAFAGVPALAEAAVTAARLARADGGSRLTIAVNSATRWSLRATTRPARLVLSLPGTTGAARRGSARPVWCAARAGTTPTSGC
ncbi:hypothetical protein [Teichococcus aestuarii]|uniref:hypothetical protein n=1 Tax=Teichococcus aestuarii TaxID=568898 RepID=UPI00360C72A2